MTLYTKIRKYGDLKETLEMETEKILNPIVGEVERQDKKFLLLRPDINTLWVKWLVMCPKGACYTDHHYLLLLIQADQETHEIDLVLAAYWNPSIDAFCFEVVGEHPVPYLNKLKSEMLSNMPLPDLEELKEDQTYEIEDELERRVKELKRFPLNKGIHPTVIGKVILNEARKVHNSLKIRIPKKDGWDEEGNPFNRPHLRLIK